MAAAGSRQSIKSIVFSYLEDSRPKIVDRETLGRICRHVDKTLGRDKPVSAAYVLDIVCQTEVPVERLLGGLPVDLRGRVHFHDREAAAASLQEMTAEYEAARAAGDKTRAADCRRAVQKGKDRLKMILRRRGLATAKREEKLELLEWFLVWLEAPQLFPQWLVLRLKATAQDAGRHGAGGHAIGLKEPESSTRD